MDFEKLVRKRRSVKKFHFNKKPNWRDIIDAIDNARLIPAAGNIYNLKFILVSNTDIIKQLADACAQSFIAEASYVVVCVSDESLLTRMYGDLGKRYTAQQAGASIENFLLGLTERGLATTWIGYFYEEMVRGLLGIPEKITIEALFPVGIEGKHNTRKEQRKQDLDTIMFFDKYGRKTMTDRGSFPVSQN